MTQHTPEPWKIDPSNEFPLAVITDDGEGTGICEFDVEKDVATDEVIANAQLIAAAPELLKILLRAESTVQQGKPLNVKWLVDAQAAIAKATP